MEMDRADRRTDPAADRHRGLAPEAPQPAERPVPLLPGRARGARALRREVVREPLAGDARRSLRDGAVHPGPRRRVLDARAVPAPAGSSTCGPSGPRRSALATTSTTCWCSRTAVPRSAPRSPIRTARSTPTARSHPSRCASSSTGCSTSSTWPPELVVSTARRLDRAGCRRPRCGPTSCASPPARAVGALTDDACDRDGLADAAHRRAGAPRPALRRADALHDVVPPAPDRRRRLARRHGCTCTSARSTGRRGCSATSRRRSWAAG